MIPSLLKLLSKIQDVPSAIEAPENSSNGDILSSSYGSVGNKLELLAGAHVYRLRADMPTEAICFLIFETDNEDEINIKLKQLYDFIMWLCECNLPHNLFMTPNRIGAVDVLKIFVYARRNYCVVKDVSIISIGFCELSGYVPVGDKRLYESITEEQLIARIREETGEAYKEIYKYFTK